MTLAGFLEDMTTLFAFLWEQVGNCFSLLTDNIVGQIILGGIILGIIGYAISLILNHLHK